MASEFDKGRTSLSRDELRAKSLKDESDNLATAYIAKFSSLLTPLENLGYEHTCTHQLVRETETLIRCSVSPPEMLIPESYNNKGARLGLTFLATEPLRFHILPSSESGPGWGSMLIRYCDKEFGRDSWLNLNADQLENVFGRWHQHLEDTVSRTNKRDRVTSPPSRNRKSPRPVSAGDAVGEFVAFLIVLVLVFLGGSLITWLGGGLLVAIVQQILENKAGTSFSGAAFEMVDKISWYGGGAVATIFGFFWGQGRWRIIVKGFFVSTISIAGLVAIAWLMFF